MACAEMTCPGVQCVAHMASAAARCSVWLNVHQGCVLPSTLISPSGTVTGEVNIGNIKHPAHSCGVAIAIKSRCLANRPSALPAGLARPAHGSSTNIFEYAPIALMWLQDMKFSVQLGRKPKKATPLRMMWDKRSREHQCRRQASSLWEERAHWDDKWLDEQLTRAMTCGV